MEGALLLLANGISELLVVVPLAADLDRRAVPLEDVVKLLLHGLGVGRDLRRVQQEQRLVLMNRHSFLGKRLPWFKGIRLDPSRTRGREQPSCFRAPLRVAANLLLFLRFRRAVEL